MRLAVTAFVLGLLLLCGTRAFAQEPAPPAGPLVHPQGQGAFRWRLGTGLMLDVLPARPT